MVPSHRNRDHFRIIALLRVHGHVHVVLHNHWIYPPMRTTTVAGTVSIYLVHSILPVQRVRSQRDLCIYIAKTTGLGPYRRIRFNSKACSITSAIMKLQNAAFDMACSIVLAWNFFLNIFMSVILRSCSILRVLVWMLCNSSDNVIHLSSKETVSPRAACNPPLTFSSSS